MKCTSRLKRRGALTRVHRQTIWTGLQDCCDNGRLLQRGKLNCGRGPAADLAVERDAAALQQGELLGDRQPKPGAAARPRTRDIDAVEALEYAFQVLGRDSWTVL